MKYGNIDNLRKLLYNLNEIKFNCFIKTNKKKISKVWGVVMKWYKIIFNINRMRDASGGKMLYYAIRNLALYAIGLAIFLGGVFINESNEILSLALLVVGGLCLIIVTLYQFLLIGFASAKINRDDDKGKNVASLIITLFSIVIIAVLVFLMLNRIL